MSEKASVTRVRTISILIAAPPVLFAIYVGKLPFFVLMAGCALLAAREFIAFLKEKSNLFLLGSALALNVLMVAAANYWPTGFFQSQWLFLGLIAFGAFIFLMEIRNARIFLQNSLTAHFLRSLWVIGIPLSFMVLLRHLPQGLPYFFILVLAIWFFDTFAYLIGKRFGKNKLYEQISPKKTVEGFLGGMIALFIFFNGVYFFFNQLAAFQENYGLIFFLTLTISIFSTLGDLSESLLKRHFNIKHSGDFLPGHGGILDRLDSFIMVAPLYYYLIYFYIS